MFHMLRAVPCSMVFSRIIEALSFLNVMESIGLIPNMCIYNILIDGLSKDGQYVKP